jgi:hypothetical protein
VSSLSAIPATECEERLLWEVRGLGMFGSPGPLSWADMGGVGVVMSGVDVWVCCVNLARALSF